MKIYVGLTDWSWFDYLRSSDCNEVNFWKPSGAPFKALQEGDLFLFRTKAAHGGKIVGGGFFTKYLTMTVDWAWRAFGTENGVHNLAELSDRISSYRTRKNLLIENPKIGCIILNDVFYFDERDWFDAPGNWRSIVTGKGYSLDDEDGKWLMKQVSMRRMSMDLSTLTAEPQQPIIDQGADRYAVSQTKHRLGQGAFRALVADAYHDRCAITGEKTMPVLQAAHIKPYSQDGPHAVSNGLFLRSDIHTLFDTGYITVTPKLTIEVSKRLHKGFGNGHIYYAYQGEELQIIPDDAGNRPSKDFLEWHNDCLFLK